MVGKITWKPGIKITPLMHWLENGGPQFGFPDCSELCPADYRFFYSSNISVKKQLLKDTGIFDEEFPFASFEDTELAYRLHKRGGLSLFYDPGAIALHDHYITFAQCRERMEHVGYSARLLVQKHPELEPLFHFMEDILRARFKNSIRYLCFPFGYIVRSRKIMHPFFWQVMAKHFMIGYHGESH
jgi:GT2 family glycosyltransferase